MPRIGLTVALFLSMTATLTVAQPAQDSHCTEDSAGVFLSRSAFAHGYRHGYEAGYHVGNIDANMARPQKTKLRSMRGVSSGYRPTFGSKPSFESGFRSGLEAGYRDGYVGRNFRAVTELRSLAASLDAQADADPANNYFDKGVRAGYDQGIRNAAPAQSASKFDFSRVSCPGTGSASAHSQLQQIYCEGYRRGFILGQSDGITLGPEHGLLEASR